MAFCANCGSERADGAAFCGKCGAAGGAGSAPAAPAYSAPAAPAGAVPTSVTLALVFAFLIPLVGLILALVGKKEADAIGGLAASRNKLALTLSIVFISLSVVFWIIWAVAAASMYGSMYSGY